jgi:hypothetical protein
MLADARFGRNRGVSVCRHIHGAGRARSVPELPDRDLACLANESPETVRAPPHEAHSRMKEFPCVRVFGQSKRHMTVGDRGRNWPVGLELLILALNLRLGNVA